MNIEAMKETLRELEHELQDIKIVGNNDTIKIVEELREMIKKAE